MPRTLRFLYEREEIPAQLVSFSRDSIYGKKSVERRSDTGELYYMANLTSDGIHIIPNGGMSSAYINPKGKNVSRNDLMVVDEKREPLYVTQSMYSHPIELGPTISLQHFFGYQFDRTYILECEDESQKDLLLQKCQEFLKKNRFMRFTYAYYPTTEPKDAILIPKEVDLFVEVGLYQEPILFEPVQFEYWEEEAIDMEQELLEFEVW